MRFKPKQPGSRALPSDAPPNHLSEDDFLSLPLWGGPVPLHEASERHQPKITSEPGDRRRELSKGHREQTPEHDRTDSCNPHTLPTLSASFCSPSTPPSVLKASAAPTSIHSGNPMLLVYPSLLTNRALSRWARQDYWSGLLFPSPGDLPNAGIKPGLLHCRQILYQLSY